MKQILSRHDLILTEAAIVERLRRSGNVELHDTLLNAPLIYDEPGREALTEFYQGYINIAKQAGLPIFLGTPTWRANQLRVEHSNVRTTVNIDAAEFMKNLCATVENQDATIKIGGLIACKHDCYQPDQGLSAVQSESFHSW